MSRHPCPPLLALLALLAIAGASCGTPAPGIRPPSPPPAPADPPASANLLGWDEVSPLAFEELVEAELPDGRVTALGEFQIAGLERALDEQSPLSVRAAVILGRSRTTAAARVLLARLEKRVLGPARNSDAGDTVAAAALLHFPEARRHAERLEALSIGSNPHPDLEVRVECACTALALGRDAVVPFLLVVLRIGTWKGLEDERDFPASDTTAWARGRAAIALSRRAEVPVTYCTDAAIGDRELEVEKLQLALRGRGLCD